MAERKKRPGKSAVKPNADRWEKGEMDFDQQEKRGLLLYGRNPVLEALASQQPIEKIYVLDKDRQDGPLGEILSLARLRNIPIGEVSAKRLDGLVFAQMPNLEKALHQGVVALLPPVQYASLENVLRSFREGEGTPFLLILDGLEDPHNLGAILRTAAAAGVDGVILPKHRAVGVNGTVVKISAGAAFNVPIMRETNLVRCAERLQREGYWIAGADMAGQSMYSAPMEGPIALVVGSEGEGISALLKKKCDFLVSVPMANSLNSLNASVSAALLIYEKRRRDGINIHEG